MKLEEAKEIIKSIDTLDDYELQEAIETVIGELFAMQNLLDEKNEEIEHLQKENEELKAKQVMQEFKIDWCEKNTIKKCEIKAIFSTYEARREQGEAVIGYWVLKDFVKKLLGENEKVIR